MISSIDSNISYAIAIAVSGLLGDVISLSLLPFK